VLHHEDHEGHEEERCVVLLWHKAEAELYYYGIKQKRTWNDFLRVYQTFFHAFLRALRVLRGKYFSVNVWFFCYKGSS